MCVFMLGNGLLIFDWYNKNKCEINYINWILFVGLFEYCLKFFLCKFI